MNTSHNDTSLIARDQDLSTDLRTAREEVYRSNSRLERALDQVQARILSGGDRVERAIDRVENVTTRIGGITGRGREVLDQTRAQAGELRARAVVPVGYVRRRPALFVGTIAIGGAALFWAYRKGYLQRLMANRHRIPEIRGEVMRMRGDFMSFFEAMNRSPLVRSVIDRVLGRMGRPSQDTPVATAASHQGPMTFEPRIVGGVDTERKSA